LLAGTEWGDRYRESGGNGDELSQCPMNGGEREFAEKRKNVERVFVSR